MSYRVKSALTFVAVVVVSAGVLAGGGAAQADEVWYQGYERVSSSEVCTEQPGETPWQASWGPDASWHPSWEMWANGGRGGWTCWRAITWARDPVAAGAAASTSYSIGGTGPGGGIVFYKDLTQPAGMQYMEAAPSTWSGGSADPSIVWCSNTDTLIAGTFGTAIGTGKVNTDNMDAGGACTSGAANSVRAYGTVGAPAGNWSLPSLDELNALDVSGVGGLSNFGNYWSSSQSSAGIAWYQFVGVGGSQAPAFKYDSLRVRPVRAF